MKSLLILFVVVAGGCANNMEHIARAMENREPIRCSFTDRFGDVQNFEGPICEDIARSKMQSEAYNACGSLSAGNEGMCLVAVALGNSGSHAAGSRTSDDVQLLIAAMNNDSRIMAAWISQIPIVGTAINAHYSYKSNKALYDAFASGLSTPGTMNITQSNDGGGDGEGAGGRGGDGDLIVIHGDGAQGINRSDGSVTNQGRNGMFLGINEPDNSFSENTAPAVEFSDDDGGQSLLDF